MKYKYDRFEFEIPNPQGFDHFEPGRILFLSVSGSHSYGTARPDSDLDVRGVYVTPITDLVGMGHNNQKTKSATDIGSSEVDLSLMHVREYLRQLLRGNCNALDNLFQEKIPLREIVPSMCSRIEFSVNDEYTRELQDLFWQWGMSKRFAKSFKGFSISQEKDFKKLNKIKCILYVYRLLGEGIILYEEDRWTPNIHEIYDYLDSPTLNVMLENYVNEQSIAGAVLRAEMDKDIEKLRNRLEESADRSDYPELGDREPFNNWLYELYGV